MKNRKRLDLAMKIFAVLIILLMALPLVGSWWSF